MSSLYLQQYFMSSTDLRLDSLIKLFILSQKFTRIYSDHSQEIPAL